jgi:hypothetical protein
MSEPKKLTFAYNNDRREYPRESKRRLEILFLEALMLDCCLVPLVF